MKKHTQKFKEQIKKFGRQIDSRITYGDKTIEAEELFSITPNFKSDILKSAMKELEFETSVKLELNQELKYEFGLLIEETGEYEYLNYGNYYVYSVEFNEDTQTYSYVCYDKMLNSMVEYEKLNNGEFPMTVREYLKNICKDLNILFSIKNSNFTNYDKMIEMDLYENLGYTYRDVLDELAQVTASTICINENDELEVRYVNELLEYETKSGSNIEIDNSVKDKANKFTIYGASEQEETPTPNNPIEIKTLPNVKNLFNKYGDFKYGNTNYATSLQSDGTIKTTANYYSRRSSGQLIENLKTNTDYIFTGTLISADGTSANQTVIEIFDKNTTRINRTYITNTTVKPYNFSIIFNTGNNDAIWISLSGNNSSADGFTNTVFDNIQLEEGTVAHNYVPYGNWLRLDNHGKNLFDKNNLLKGVRLVPQGTTTSDTNYYTSDYIQVKSNTIYTKNSPIQDAYHRICFYDKNKTLITASNNNTYTTPNNTNYIRFCGLLTEIDNTMYEQGRTTTEYEPYRDDVTYINLDKENLFDKNKINKINAYFETTGNIISNANNRVIYIECLPNTNYLIEQGISTLSNHLLYIATTNILPNDGVEINNCFRMENNKSHIYTTNNTAKYLIFRIRSGDDVDSYYSDFKIYNGITPYYELCSIDSVRNKLEAVSGKGIQRIVKVIFNGSENITHYSVAQGHLFRLNLPLNAKVSTISNSHVISDYYLPSYYDGRKDGTLYIGGTTILDIIDNRYDNVTNYKTWLSNNPVTVYYELAEEQPFEIKPTNIKLFEGYNNIELLTDVDTEMECEYATGYETINEEYLKDVNVSFGEKYGPINSIVLSRSGGADNIYLQDEESIAKNGLCELKIEDNQIMNGNDRSDYLPGILNKLDGLEYYLNDFKSTGIMYLDMLDNYKVEIGENKYNCLMLNDEPNITQGLEESIYTELPIQTETDYTKADKTDRKLNQTTLMVDKQNQQIEGLVKKIVDLTSEKNGLNYLHLENASEGHLLDLTIEGRINLIYPKNDLYPSNTLFPKDIYLVIDKETNPTEEIKKIRLPIKELNLKDKFYYSNGKCWIIKENGSKEELEDIKIELFEGENYLYLESFKNDNLKLYCKYALKSEYTDLFTTKLDMQSTITQTADQINLEVSKKVDTGDVVSTINQSAEQITLKSNRLVVESDGFTLDGYGNMTATSGEIGGFNLTENELNAHFTLPYQYTQSDRNRMIQILMHQIEPTQEDYDRYNISRTSEISSLDLMIISKLINGTESYNSEFLINTLKPTDAITIINENGEKRVSIGAYGSYFTNLSTVNFETYSVNASNFINVGENIALNGEEGNIRCVSLTQTSLEENKKNFEKFENAIEEIKKTDIYKYNLKDEKDESKKHLGFVIGNNYNYSHEITAIDKEGNEVGVDNYSMTSLCLQAIKELNEKIEMLENKIKEMESEK